MQLEVQQIPRRYLPTASCVTYLLAVCERNSHYDTEGTEYVRFK